MDQATETRAVRGSPAGTDPAPDLASFWKAFGSAPAPAADSGDATADRVSERTELIVRIERDQGSVARLMEFLAGRGIRVLNRCSLSDTHGATVLMVTDQDTAARRALEEEGLSYRAEPVVVIETSGAMAASPQFGHWLMTAGVGIIYSYVSRAGTDRSYSVFKTVDDRRAIAVLRDRLAPASSGDGKPGGLSDP